MEIELLWKILHNIYLLHIVWIQSAYYYTSQTVMHLCNTHRLTTDGNEITIFEYFFIQMAFLKFTLIVLQKLLL